MPDRAVLYCAIDAEGSTREAAYTGAAESAQRVDGVLESHGEALGRVTTNTLMVHPKTRWRRGESVRTGWRASRASTVEVSGFDHLGVLIAELAGAGASITGPTWRLDAANPIHSQVRRSAAQDARQRASDYAVALGLEVTGIAWISEPGLRQQTEMAQALGGLPAIGRPRAAAAEETIEVTPEEIVARASVEVSFRFTLATGPDAT